MTQLQSQRLLKSVISNLIVGLTISFVMLNLGIAMGILSGRGAFAGMISAAIIAFITAAFGGTRIQGSGPTAPMGALTATVVAYASENISADVMGITGDQFINLVLLMTAVFIIIAGLFKLGRFIKYVPALVVSGFMSGIALIIWVLQFELLTGIGRDPIEGSRVINCIIALSTLCIAFLAPPAIKKVSSRWGGLIPGTLVALIVISVLANVFDAPVAHVSIDISISNREEFFGFLASQVPTHINLAILLMALPFALKLSALCYIDTLLTSLIVDKITASRTRQNKELMAQGTATALVGLVGGTPGAQSTVPSVLTIKEGATTRLAGICASLFIMLEIILFADLVEYIPQAVFAGILIKVGWDVFDFKPIWAYIRTLRKRARKRPTKIVGHKEMAVVSGTTLATAFIDLIIAVGMFTFGYYFVNKVIKRKADEIIDYVP